MALVSIIVPVHNEAATISGVLDRLAELPLDHEVIVVDDGSDDGTTELLQSRARSDGITLFRHDRKRGKGAAVITGLTAARGDVIIIQDGDNEYDPADIPRVVAPILAGERQVAYGSRFLGRIERMALPNYIANRLLTFLANLLYGARLTDEATAYKAFRREVITSIPLRARGFEFCPEVTAKVLKRGYRLVEVPIKYRGRTVPEGKEICWKDGLRAMWALIRYRFRD